MKKVYDAKNNLLQTPWAAAAFIAGASSLFLAGYFWGHKTALTTFTNKMEQDSLADQIYSSMCTLYDTNPQQNGAMAQAISQTDETQNSLSYAIPQAQPASHNIDTTTLAPSSSYHAQLVSFMSHKQAQAFARRLEKKGITVYIKKRTSKTARGIPKIWYQVVTRNFQDKDALLALVETIQQHERISGIVIR
ncbi:hypothetical protein J120_03675 [candidate division TM6 bacterium JCVI TM6SC1]|uniref:SPOR domain-containing protein n=1 Tax=candidate division TM6 bacterium JCVI TM6SC1 TaxID=1306947 RepID=A0A0D2I1C2_9BACT|nr:hypothetical protein J120_03675 [candidate division TM6 bacterium JCVI TM6SC1]